MEKNRKILISILAMLTLSIVLAIADVGLKIQEKSKLQIEKGSQVLSGNGIGIVRIEGAISFAKQGGLFGGENGAEAIISRLDLLSNSSNVKAIVIRINSPGGTVGATEEIYQKILKIRKKNIPIIASVGEIAASGGYYAAAACNEIMANHGSITGSIGVIAVSPNVSKLFKKLGIDMNVIKSGKHKDIFSSHRDMTKKEKFLIQEMIDSSYKKFLKDVAFGRSMNQSDIEPYADGRVFNGSKALKLKLIDKLGTFEDALDRAAELASLGENYPVYDVVSSPFEKFFGKLENLSSGFEFFRMFFDSSDSKNLYNYKYGN